MEQKYCAFISYRHVSPDSDIAKALHTAIETYGIPGSIKKRTGRKNMGKVFRDQEELPLSADLGADIEAALDKSDWLVCVCSPRYLESLWCMREVEYFLEHKGRDRILAVLAEGEPEDSFPDALCHETRENGETVEVEPLAADLRGENRKKLRGESLRLLAPMLGVSYDDLKRRARQRRLRQIVAACAAFLVLAGAVSAYAVSNRAKNERLRLEAEAQQRIAAEQQQLAEERKRQAEEEAKRAEEEKARAEEEARKAAEEQARAEEERIRAVSNSIGELLERAAANISANENRIAAADLLDALALSEEENGLRREEIIPLLRRSLYITPFASVSSFTGQNVRLNDIVPAPDGNLAVGIENGNSAALIDLEANEIRYRVQVGNGQILQLRFSAQGDRFLALCDQGRMVTVWNTEDGSEAFRYVSKANQPYHIANAEFWRDGNTLLVQDMDRFYLVSADGTEKLIYTMGEHQEWYSREENFFTWIFQVPLEDLYTTQMDDYTGTNMCVSADGSRILISGRDGSTGALIIDEKGNLVTPLYVMPGTFLEKYTLSPDGKVAACITYLGFLAWWDAETGDLMQIFGYDNSRGGAFSEIVFSPEGDRLAVVVNNELRIYDVQTGDLLISGTMDQTNITPSVAYSADADWLFLTNQSLFVIDARTGALYGMSDAEFANAYNNAVQMGDWLFVTRANGSTELLAMPALSCVERVGRYTGALCPEYDPQTTPAGQSSVSLKAEHQLTEAFKQTTYLTDLSPKLCFDRAGTRAALYYPDGVIELFDLAGDGSVEAMLGQLTQEMSAFGMTEKYLAACDAGGRLLFYDLEAESVIRIVNLESPYVRFAFNAEGNMLLALRQSGLLDVYDIPSAQQVLGLRSTEAFTDFGFASDGSAVVGFTASGAEVASLWPDEEALIARAKQLTGRD